jgi:tRNA wybutosine-synthesizing protein 2
MVLKPVKQIRKSLKNKIPREYIRVVPSKWEKIGDVLTIRLDERLEGYKTVIAEVYSNILNCKTILNDIGGISGELREPNVEVLYGPSDTETTHIENGIHFKLEPKKIMFSSGNMSERINMSKISCEDEIIIDFFAGIGYFTLPIAVYGKPKKIYACEKNPTAFDYLKENIVLNNVTKIVEPLKGDNRDVAPENIADRIIMGYIGGTEQFFPKAIKCLRNNKGIIHFHEKYPEKIALDEVVETLGKKAKEFSRKINLLDVRDIKSYAPGISHFVFDCEIL